MGNIDRAFEYRLAQAVVSIPYNLTGLMESRKQSIVLAPSVVDYEPSLLRFSPRGWSSDTTWENADGAFMSKHGAVVVAQGRRFKGGVWKETPEDWLGVFFHELGHGVDQALGNYSQSPEFVAAYLEDMSKVIGTAIEKKLSYYLQGFELKKKVSSAGLQEALAESFALNCGRATRRRDTALHRRVFVQTRLAVHRRLIQL